MEPHGRTTDEKKEDVHLKFEASETYTTDIPTQGSKKTADILEACECKDIESLRQLATSEGGLLTDELRRKACKSPDFTSAAITHS